MVSAITSFSRKQHLCNLAAAGSCRYLVRLTRNLTKAGPPIAFCQHTAHLYADR